MAKNTNYAKLMIEINKLKQKAEAVRSQEASSVIASIKQQMAKHGITPQDLMDNPEMPQARIIHTRRKPDAKYKDPVTGATWAGRGKTPSWMKPALEKGMTKEHFSIS